MAFLPPSALSQRQTRNRISPSLSRYAQRLVGVPYLECGGAFGRPRGMGVIGFHSSFAVPWASRLKPRSGPAGYTPYFEARALSTCSCVQPPWS